MNSAAGDTNPYPRLLAWLSWLPPIAALAWTVWLRTGLPEPAAWVWRRHEAQPPMELVELLRAQEPVKYWLAELWQWAIAAVPEVGYADLALLSWCLALLLWRMSLGLCRRIQGRRLHWVWAILLPAWVFHPQWGATWLLAERSREFLPLLFLVLGLRQLLAASAGAWRIRLALLWACAATASGPAGGAVFLALALLVPQAARRADLPRPGREAVVFAVLVGVFQLFVTQALRREQAAEGLWTALVEDPGELGGWVLELCGSPACAGVLVLLLSCLLLVLPALRFRRWQERGCGLGLCLVVYGLWSLVHLVDRFYVPAVGSGRVEVAQVWESGQFLLALGGGALILLRTCCSRLYATLVPVLMGGLLVLTLQSWFHGSRALRVQALGLQQQAALLLIDELSAGELLPKPPVASGIEHTILPLSRLASLRAQGKLDTLPALPGFLLSDGYPPVQPGRGRLSGVEGRTVRAELTGSPWRPVPAVVLLWRQEGQDWRLDGLLQARLDASLRRVAASGGLLQETAPAEGQAVQGIGLQVAPLRLRSLQGRLRWRAGQWQLEEEER